MRPNDDTMARVAAILERIAKTSPTAVTPEKSLRRDFGIDSLSMIDVVVAAEDEFGVIISDDDTERIDTVEDLVRRLDEAKGKEP